MFLAEMFVPIVTVLFLVQLVCGVTMAQPRTWKEQMPSGWRLIWRSNEPRRYWKYMAWGAVTCLFLWTLYLVLPHPLFVIPIVGVAGFIVGSVALVQMLIRSDRGN